MVIENTLDLKKSLQRLLSAKEAAGRRLSAGVLLENAKFNKVNEKGKAEKAAKAAKAALLPVTHCSEWEAS